MWAQISGPVLKVSRQTLAWIMHPISPRQSRKWSSSHILFPRSQAADNFWTSHFRCRHFVRIKTLPCFAFMDWLKLHLPKCPVGDVWNNATLIRVCTPYDINLGLFPVQLSKPASTGRRRVMYHRVMFICCALCCFMTIHVRISEGSQKMPGLEKCILIGK